LKISGYVLLGMAFLTLFGGIVHTWRNDNPFEDFASVTVVLIALAFFCLSLSKKKETDEERKNK
jgi:hypothetical protein